MICGSFYKHFYSQNKYKNFKCGKKKKRKKIKMFFGLSLIKLLIKEVTNTIFLCNVRKLFYIIKCNFLKTIINKV